MTDEDTIAAFRTLREEIAELKAEASARARIDMALRFLGYCERTRGSRVTQAEMIDELRGTLTGARDIGTIKKERPVL